MGFFSQWFSKSDDARVARAERYLDKKRYNAARLELDGIDSARADEIRQHALKVLADRNLHEARARLTSGDAQGAKEHLGLARQFGASTEDIRSVRRYGRTLREQAQQKAAEEAASRPTIEPVGDDPIWSLAPDDPTLRFALLIEGYPEELRDKMAGLGKDFAAAVILLEEGQANAAFKALTEFTHKEPVARFERARAAIASGQLAAASSDLMTFGDEVGHQRIRKTHSAALLASVLTRLGRGEEALSHIEAVMKTDPDLELEATRSQLLENVNKLSEAEKAAEDLLRKAPREMGVYRQLARVRDKLGNRMGAMHVLESGLQTCCSSPGSCGNQPLDIQAVRMLVRMYLEERLDPKRTEELMDKLRHHVKEETWDDMYIQALVRRNDAHPDTQKLVQRLVGALKPGDRRINVIKQAFGEMVSTPAP